MEKLKGRNLSVILSHEENTVDDFSTMENRVANSTVLIGVLTKDAVNQKELVFAMTAAKHYYKSVSQVILVLMTECLLLKHLGS